MGKKALILGFAVICLVSQLKNKILQQHSSIKSSKKIKMFISFPNIDELMFFKNVNSRKEN